VAAEDPDWADDQQNACQSGYDPDELARPERLFDKEKVGQHRDHEWNAGLQHCHHGALDAADCDGGQNIS
jgi:hypothetical protein